MKRATFIILFVATHLIVIIAYINKSNRFIKAHYTKQEFEEQKKILNEKQQGLLQKLCEMKKPSNIIKNAKKQNMRKVKLNQVKKLTVNG